MKLNFATWNAGTLWNDPKTCSDAEQRRKERLESLVFDFMEEEGFDLFGISETHWVEKGYYYDREHDGGKHVYYSGNSCDGYHREGVALILNGKAHEMVCDVIMHSNRIIAAKFNIPKKYTTIQQKDSPKLLVVMIYAPYQAPNKRAKREDFVKEELTQFIKHHKREKDSLVIMGDFNERTSTDCLALRDFCRKHCRIAIAEELKNHIDVICGDGISHISIIPAPPNAAGNAHREIICARNTLKPAAVAPLEYPLTDRKSMIISINVFKLFILCDCPINLQP